jgi:hypothetical protein
MWFWRDEGPKKRQVRRATPRSAWTFAEIGSRP